MAKEQHGALPADLLADVTQFAMPALAGQAARLVERLRLLERVAPFNLFISNVPGPNVPLYFAGAELQAYYPLSAIADGQGLNITVMSYRDGMYFGLIACRELVPDVDDMAGHIVTELDLLTAEVDRRAAPEDSSEHDRESNGCSWNCDSLVFLCSLSPGAHHDGLSSRGGSSVWPGL